MRQLFFILALSTLVQVPIVAEYCQDEPWFAGPLLAFPGKNRDPGEISFEPYFYWTRLPGSYDKDSSFVSNRNTHQYHGELELRIGLIKNVGLELDFNQIYSYSADTTRVVYGSVNAYLSFQLLEQRHCCWYPDVRILVGESIPTGRFTRVNSSLQETVVASSGSSAALAVLAAEKVFNPHGRHPYNWTVNLTFLMPRPVDLRGVTRFSEDQETKGEYLPGVEIEGDLAFEYKFNQTWGVAIDIYYQYQTSASFNPKNRFADPPSLTSSSNLSLAPAIEYNLCDNAYLLGSLWFSVAGRNSTAFVSGAFVAFYEF